MTDQEIIQLLGGVTAVARLLDIKPPSVYGWLADGIPEGRLRELAAEIERLADGRFTRRSRWPEKFAFYWPELAHAHDYIAHPATEIIAVSTPNERTPGAVVLVAPPKPPVTPRRAARRIHPDSPYDHTDIDRRAEEGQAHFGRRITNGGADIKTPGVPHG